MQAIEVDREALTGDMYALAAFMMRSANVTQLEAVGELELSLTQIKALHVLEGNGQGDADVTQSVKALAERLGVSLAAMSRAVDGLYERGLVTREEDPADRRMKRVRATAAGLEVPRALTAGRLSALHELMGSLDEEQAAALAHALQLILATRPEIAAYRKTEKGLSR